MRFPLLYLTGQAICSEGKQYLSKAYLPYDFVINYNFECKFQQNHFNDKSDCRKKLCKHLTITSKIQNMEACMREKVFGYSLISGG